MHCSGCGQWAVGSGGWRREIGALGNNLIKYQSPAQLKSKLKWALDNGLALDTSIFIRSKTCSRLACKGFDVYRTLQGQAMALAKAVQRRQIKGYRLS